MHWDNRLKETHISLLLFFGDRVYKVKKPVKTGFLDFTGVGDRQRACEREVELNRRLAPDIYLGVAEVTLGDEVVDHMVVMRRLSEASRLSARLDAPDVDDDLRHIAHLVAAFHSGADRSPQIDDAAGHAAMLELWEQGISQMSIFAGPVLDADEVRRVDLLARAYLAGRRPVFDERISAGRACDGHGDLQAEDIFVLDDGPRVLDCLEFDDRLRYGDVLADVAFLAMDLERLGHRELGRRFLEVYRELTADQWPESLAHHHVAYRAHVRAKVACLRHAQGDEGAADSARRLHRLALDHLEAGRVRLVVVGGSPGTGKSVVARGLGERLGAVVVSSDSVRDELYPRDDRVELDRGRYSPDLVASVYDEILRRAELLLGRGETVVLDASWLDPDQRARARSLALSTSSELFELRCSCPDDVAASRIEARAALGTDPSEATVVIARHLASIASPWPEATVLSTTGDPDDGVARALDALDVRVAAHR